MTPNQSHMLTTLVEAGGSGRLDSIGRVCIGPARSPIQGDATAWLVLVSEGMVAGERGLIIATERGRDSVAHLVGGRTREARG